MRLKISMGRAAKSIEVTNANTGEHVESLTNVRFYLSPGASNVVFGSSDVVFGSGDDQRIVRISEFTCTFEDFPASVEEEALFRKELFFIRDTLLLRADKSLLVLSPQAMQELEDTINNDVCEYLSRYIKGTAEERKGLLPEFKNKRYYVKEEEPEDED